MYLSPPRDTPSRHKRAGQKETDNHSANGPYLLLLPKDLVPFLCSTVHPKKTVPQYLEATSGYCTGPMQEGEEERIYTGFHKLNLDLSLIGVKP